MQSPANQNPESQPARSGVEAITKALAAPFEASEVRFKPAVVSGNRALALAYVDARVIQDRLDDVLGVEGWQDDYEFLPGGSVVCRLKVRLGGEWLTKVDVGGPSEQPDDGDKRKAAVSDALKRAAVKFGVGRYLYRLPSQWVDYDPHKRQFVRTPTVPAYALPPREKQAPAQPPGKPAPVGAVGEPPTPPRKVATRTALHTLPGNGAELQRRLYDYDARLAAQGLCAPGALVKHVVAAGVKAGHDSDLSTWSGPAIALAAEEVKAFEGHARQRQTRPKEVA